MLCCSESFAPTLNVSNDLNPGSSSAAEHATVRVAVSVNPSREVTARWSNVVIVLVTAVVAMAVVVGQPARSYWYHSLGWTPSEV